MKDSFPNHYEMAFQNWLIDQRIDYIALNEQNVIRQGGTGIKSFDFLLHLETGRKIIAEVKGRKFKGTSLENLSSLECWVTTDDVDGLTKWLAISGTGYEAVFVFAYKIDNIDVDFDGREIFEYDSNRYVFFCVKLDDYCKYMKQRSPKWKTVTLAADKFRQCVIPLSDYIS